MCSFDCSSALKFNAVVEWWDEYIACVSLPLIASKSLSDFGTPFYWYSGTRFYCLAIDCTLFWVFSTTLVLLEAIDSTSSPRCDGRISGGPNCFNKLPTPSRHCGLPHPGITLDFVHVIPINTFRRRTTTQTSKLPAILLGDSEFSCYVVDAPETICHDKSPIAEPG